MVKSAFSSYANENGGRVLLLFLLFLLALYSFVTQGFGAFAIVCAIPVVALVVLAGFQYRLSSFWALMLVNYVVQWKSMPLPSGIPTSMYNEMFELILIALAVIDARDTKFERTANAMMFALTIWCGYCTLQVLNDTCELGLDVGGWYTAARLMAFQMMYAFLVYTLYITKPRILIQYLYVWGALSLFAVIWVWKQKTFGLTSAENAWLQTRGRSTHILAGGTLIRYFSVYSDAANFGIAMASTAVAFIVFGITSSVRKYRYFFLAVGAACAWATLPSGTRTALACLMAGFAAYIFLSKSVKIAVPFTILFVIALCLLRFTTIGNGNQQIRRMRSAFDKNDASANQRAINQEVMRKYMNEAPWGIGMNIGYQNVPVNNKFAVMATIPPDSEYVFVWIHTGIIGITIFLITTAIMIIGGCCIVLFRLRSPSLRGIGAGLCCAFISQQLGGYGNQVLMQFPNCLIFYGGLSIVYILPHIENEWIAFEQEKLSIQNRKKQLKLEQKRASRV